MPYLELMSFSASQKLWRRFHLGTRYVVSCRQLGLPKEQWTREASRDKANEWWRNKELSLAQIEQSPFTPIQTELLAELSRRKAFAQCFDPSLLRELNEREEAIKSCPNPTIFHLEGLHEGKVAKAAAEMGLEQPPYAETESFADAFTDRKVWKERTSKIETIDEEKQFVKLVEKYLAQKMRTEENGIQSMNTTEYQRYSLNRFLGFIGRETSVDAMSYELWHSWSEHCQTQVINKEWSNKTAKGTLSEARAFCKWLEKTKRLLELPSNFNDCKIKLITTEPVIFTDAEITKLIKASAEHFQLRCILLLAINTGMANVDIASLRLTELDMKAGTITRKRIKTSKQENVPVVTYHLWPETIKELKANCATSGEFVLVNSVGKLWVDKHRVDGRFQNNDNIRSAFIRLCKKCKIKGKSFKAFRATSGSKLGNHEKYRPFAPLFMGHAPETVFEKHYLVENGHILTEGIKWLRTQYEI